MSLQFLDQLLLADGDSHDALREVRFADADLSSVPMATVAPALFTRLERVSVQRLSSLQWTVLLSHLLVPGCGRRRLTGADLSAARLVDVRPPELVAEALLSLTRVSLAHATMAEEQLAELFRTLAAAGGKKRPLPLADLDLDHVNLGSVPPDYLGRGVAHLR